MANPALETTVDLNPLVELLNPYAARGRTALLPALHATQEEYGYLPPAAAAEVARRLRVPLADVYGVIDFYSMFHTQPTGRQVIRVCGDPPCSMLGGPERLAALSDELKVGPGQMTPDGEWTVERSPCLGRCEHAPVIAVGPRAYAAGGAPQPAEVLAGGLAPVSSVVGGEPRLLTRNCGNGQPTSLQDYRKSGGYQALRRVLEAGDPQQVIEQVTASGLVGRGGAAFPTGLKWRGAAEAAGEQKYVVNNADESEPGTFKDRVLLEDDPHASLEGMIIAGFAIGASKGFIYIRGEYQQAAETMQHAIDQASSDGYLGTNLLGSGFDFEVEIRRGAGAYICGEETALFESIEGKRGFPRIKPPFPTTVGLFGKPTVINNVETLATVPLILREGVESFRSHGTADSPGTKLFCLSGDVERPGLYEVPFGVTLRELLEFGGGVRGGLQAILLGGAAGAFATEAQLDVRLSFEDLRAAGLPLGSGVVMAFNQDRDLRLVLAGLAHFFAEESCGKCYPCQLGTQRQFEMLQALAGGAPWPDTVQTLTDVGWTMTDASLCGLGQTAASAVLSAMELWPDLFSEHGHG